MTTGRPQSSSGKKKSVGFELADSDYEGEWEDTTQSPEGTRRDSLQLNKEVAEKSKLLVDPLTFVKRPYPPASMSRAASLPEPSNVGLAHVQVTDEERHDEDDDVYDDNNDKDDGSDLEEQRASGKISEHNTDNAVQLLSQSHTEAAPPTMSSTSATGRPTGVDTVSRQSSLLNLAAAHGLHKRQNPPSPTSASQQNNPSRTSYTTENSLQGTLSSTEGVSRFIEEKRDICQSESEPNTPSFLHPHTPPSPSVSTSSVKGSDKTSPPSRLRDGEPRSRTQQKLWLQRKAALNTVPPDSHPGSPSVSTSVIDPTLRASGHTRPAYEQMRRAVNGNVRVGGHDSEAKHVRKAYEKTALELSVVRRFQSPTGDSFGRINFMLKRSNDPFTHQEYAPAVPIRPVRSSLLPHMASSSLSSSSLPHVGHHSRVSRGPNELVSSSHDPAAADIAQQSSHPQHPAQRIVVSADSSVAVHEGQEKRPPAMPTESELMIRRLWDSREVIASS